MSMVKYLPYAFAMGVPVTLFLLWAAGIIGKRRKEEAAPKLPVAVFGIYLSIMLIITFLSREGGSRNGGFDLEIFSTWGINDRNNAFVIENILLFIPYGCLACWAFRRMRKFFACLALGGFTSLLIETLQLLTGRGFFQIDDILTNTLGAAAGFLLFRLLAGKD